MHCDTEKLTKRSLDFPKPEEWYDFDRKLVAFWGMDVETRVRCEISGATLDDNFHGDNRDKLEVFRANSQAIEDIARQKYLAALDRDSIDMDIEPFATFMARRVRWSLEQRSRG